MAKDKNAPAGAATEEEGAGKTEPTTVDSPRSDGDGAQNAKEEQKDREDPSATYNNTVAVYKAEDELEDP